jgi:pimeloyl-ACP methyl ester carboxylesterase
MNISRPKPVKMAREDDQPPPSWMRLTEAMWLGARAWRGVGHLGVRGPRDGPPALVIPGFIANDRTTLELRRALAAGGWRVHPWSLGLNLGAREDTIEKLKQRIDALYAKQPVLVVGWSLGGVFARELARAHPDGIRAVVTLGSPFSGDPRANNVWKLYEWVAGHPVDAPPVPRIGDKPPVPTLAIWSRSDGIVAPAAARGLAHESDATGEMTCSHMAFGVSRRAANAVVREIDSFLQKHA